MNGRSNREQGLGNQLATSFKGLEQLGKFANTWARESESIAAIVGSTGFKIVLGIFLAVIVGLIVLWFASNFVTLVVR